MNSLSRHLTKIGTKMFTQRLLSSSPKNLPNPNTSNFGTSSKYLTPRAFMYYTGGTVLFGSAVGLSYAKYNPQFRERLKNRSETIDKVIQILWRENENKDEDKDEDIDED